VSRLRISILELIDRSSSSAGQGLAEYALIISLIAIVAILALLFLGNNVSDLLSNVGSAM
jgi:Flp pilus assembly pilin Flp